METQFENIETTEVKSDDILDALMILHVKYPDHKVEIWVCCPKDGKVTYSGIFHGDNGNKYSHDKTTPLEAATELIKEVGDYNPAEERLKTINRLREELRKLEEEGRKT